MTVFDSHEQGDWLVAQDEPTQALFLATLAFELTIVGRNSYTVQSDGLDHPEQLRTVNEIQHRVLAFLRDVLAGESNDSFQRSMAAWVLQQPNPELHYLLSSAWIGAKAKAS